MDSKSVNVLNSGGFIRLVCAGLCVGTSPIGTCADLVARDASAWTPLSWNSAEILPNSIYDLVSFNQELYGIGKFGQTGMFSRGGAAHWNGSAWSVLSGWTYTQAAYAGTLFDAGQGTQLFVGGDTALTRVVGPSLQGVASVGPPLGPTGGVVPYIKSMTVYDDGHGPALYIGGTFTIAGGVAANNVARWSGTSWSALGSGVAGASSSYADVYCLAAFDDGSGPALFAAGSFARAGGAPAGNIARWNGQGWSSMFGGVNSSVATIAAFDDGRGPALWVGGSFTAAGGIQSRYIARWIACPPACYPNCDQSPAAHLLSANDFVCFFNRFIEGDSYANCDGSTTLPVLTPSDFSCFLNAFAEGCGP